jgi:hypothetical protein
VKRETTQKREKNENENENEDERARIGTLYFELMQRNNQDKLSLSTGRKSKTRPNLSLLQSSSYQRGVDRIHFVVDFVFFVILNL